MNLRLAEALTTEQTIHVMAKLTESLQQRMIAMPRITVMPRDGAASGFRDFDLDCSEIRQSYAAQDILTIDLTENSAHRLRTISMHAAACSAIPHTHPRGAPR